MWPSFYKGTAMTLKDKRRAFRDLHASGCFILPNPWDVGSARLLAGLGFKALASTSAGMAWSMGKPDNSAALDDVLAHLKLLAEATDLPLNADFEHAFADDADGVAANVARAVAAGVSGLSVEDSTGRKDAPFYDFDLAVARIAAARAAIDRTDSGVVLTARCEAFLVGVNDLEEVKRRLTAYAAAGADCLYAPFLPDLEATAAVIAAVAPKPVNVLLPGPGRNAAELAALGARRVSVGGALARAAYGAFVAAANGLNENGAFEAFAPIAPFQSLNEALAPRA
jgi:2-methylisocitrate lyase-like PEP mutase family enzyme